MRQTADFTAPPSTKLPDAISLSLLIPFFSRTSVAAAVSSLEATIVSRLFSPNAGKT